MSLKTITSTVGEGGTNIPSDVATVQYLLNCVPVSHGGPLQELKIDGFAGVVTIEAISRFQKIQLGSSNNRVEFSGETFDALKKYDPLPYSAPVVAPNFKPSTSESMDPSKMSKSIDGGGVKNLTGDIHIKRTVDGINRLLYGGVKDDSI